MNFNNKVVKTYAKSLFQNLKSFESLSKSEELFKLSKITSADQKTFSPNIYIIGEELILIRAVLISSKKLQNFFKNPTYLEQQKFDVIVNIFPGLTLTMKSFLKLLTERNHLALLPSVCDEYNSLLSAFKNTIKVKIITASPLNESFGPMFLKTLKGLTKSEEVILNMTYNPKLLGGLVLEYNSLAIDASILKEFSLFFSDI